MARYISERFHLTVERIKARLSYKPKTPTTYSDEIEMKTVVVDHSEYTEEVPAKASWTEKWATRFHHFMDNAERVVLITAKVVLPPVSIFCRILGIMAVVAQILKRHWSV